VDVISPNWCDRTTWHDSAEQITDQALTDSGDGLTWNSPHTNWIDTYHGKLTGEDELSGMRAVVKADGVTLTEDEPFGGAQGDYSVDYAAGTVTFHASQAGKAVTATYCRENGSAWVIKPDPGKVLRLTTVEVQFSKDIVLNDTVTFQLYVGGAPYGPPTTYKTMMDYINEAAGSYAEIPAMGGGSRGTTQPIQIFRWPYAERASTDLKSSLAMEVHIKLANNNHFGGAKAIATFYGVSENEG
jgi:hypothetical protein